MKWRFVLLAIPALVAGGVPVSATAPVQPNPQPSFELWAISQGLSLSAVACLSAGEQVTCYGTTAEGAAFGATASMPDLLWTPLAGSALSSVPTSPSTTTVIVAPGSTSAAVVGQDAVFTVGDIAVPPGEAGTVSIVLTAPSQDSSSVPIVVRNQTGGTVSNVEVTGTARDSTGTLTASGTSQGFEPHNLEDGGWAMGYVYFDFDALRGGETFEFSVTFDAGASDPTFGKLNLTITEATLQGDRVVGVASNEGTTAGTLAEIYVGCFDGDGALSDVFPGFVDGSDIPAGGTSPFSVNVSGDCTAFAVAGSAFSF